MTGHRDQSVDRERCPACDGSGVDRHAELDFGRDHQAACRICHGSGHISSARHDRLEQRGVDG